MAHVRPVMARDRRRVGTPTGQLPVTAQGRRNFSTRLVFNLRAASVCWKSELDSHSNLWEGKYLVGPSDKPQHQTRWAEQAPTEPQ